MRRLFVYLVAVLLACSMLALPPLAKPGAGEVVPWESYFRSVAGIYWVERAAQTQAECGWNPLAVSPVGAVGPDQVMPKTLVWWKAMGWVPRDATGFDIPACFKGQNGHMLWLRRYWLDLDPRLAAYNAGQGRVLQAEAYAREIGWEDGNAWLYRALPRFTGAANSKQTQTYVLHNSANRAAICAKLRDAGSQP